VLPPYCVAFFFILTNSTALYLYFLNKGVVRIPVKLPEYTSGALIAKHTP
jgi:hypothetical protein